jgi:hypothetical protein
MKPMKQILLLCGILSSLLYIGADIISGATWEGYSFTSQAISELMAINAPSRPVAVPLFIMYDILVIAFGTGLLLPAAQKRLYFAGGLIIGIGITGLVTTLFYPMHLRGDETTSTDTMHIILTGITTLLIVLAMGSCARVKGKGFRWYTIITVVVLLIFGAIAGMDGPKLASQQPTPWLGVTERITIGAYLIWTAVLAIVLGSKDKSLPRRFRLLS